MKTRIEHVTVLTMDNERNIYPDGYVLMEDDRILAAGLMDDAVSSDGADLADSSGDILRIDGEHGILMPGMINVHSHIPMVPFRSMGDDCPDRLRRFLFPLEFSSMTPELIFAASRYGVAELLLSGITSVLDMYYFEDQVAEACLDMGIRAWVGETVIDMETCDSPVPGGGLSLCRPFLKKWSGHGRIHPLVAPHATNTCPPKLLQAAHALAREYDVPYTLHVSEMDYEMTYFRETYGKTPVQVLQDLGVLDEKTIAAHCIHLDEEDIRILTATGTKVAHCINANTKAGKGICPVRDLMRAGVDVGLGTDGPSSGNTLELFTQMRMAACFQKTKYHDRALLPTDQVVALATRGGATVLGAGQEIGSIEPGKKADLVLLETKSVNMFPIYNPYAAVVYSAGSSNVDSVWVDGRRLVEGHRLTGRSLSFLRSELEGRMPDFRQTAEKYQDIV